MPWPHAHSKGIIHRDIKPSNIILINLEGQPDFVKVVDFGIAKLTNSTDPQGGLTKTGEVFGSPLYMSPEQWRGHKLDARTDIYSLGTMMYRVFTGRSMFPKGDVMQLAFNHVSEMPTIFCRDRCRTSCRTRTSRLQGAGQRTRQRFQSMIELGDALKSIFREHVAAEAIGFGFVTSA